MVLLRHVHVALSATVAALGSVLFIALGRFHQRRVWNHQRDYRSIREEEEESDSRQVLVLGLDGAGKSSVLQNLCRSEPGSGPRATGPRATGPTATGPTATGPRATGPRATGPRATGPRATGPRATGPRATGPRPTGPRATGPRATGPRATGPRATGPRATGPRATGPRATSPRATSPRATGPTRGFNFISLKAPCGWMNFLEIGGGEDLRCYWSEYLRRTHILVFIVDSSDRARFPVARSELHRLLGARPHLPVVVLANKQDKAGAVSLSELRQALSLASLSDHHQIFLLPAQCSSDPPPEHLTQGLERFQDLLLQLA